MASWQSIALNKVLFRTIRSRLKTCDDILQLRPVLGRLDQMNTFFTMPTGLRIRSETIGGIPCHWVDVPQSNEQSLVLFFHGGGFCFKTPKTHAGLLGRLCRLSSTRGLMVDYRLAPEHPYPAALDDCVDTYRGLLDTGISHTRIIFAGDSAGGNLVLTTLLKARDLDLPLPAGAVLMSPATDMSMSGQSAITKYRQDPFFDFYSLLMMRNHYLDGVLPHEPLVSPCFADLTGLPPLMIQVGDREILLDDSTRVAQRARSQGVNVKLKIWPGMPHVFPVFNQVPEARQALREMAEFIAEHAH